jgi:uncharacterized protein
MSVANATMPSPSLEEERRAQEPSMEEILASIRRIIADDDKLTPIRRDRPAELRSEPVAPASPQEAYPAPALERPTEWTRPAPVEPLAAPVVQATVKALSPRPVAAPEPEALQQPEQIVDAFETAHREAYQQDNDGYRSDAYEESDVEAEQDDHYAYEPHAFAAPPSEQNSPHLISPDASESVAQHFQALTASMIIKDSGLLQEYAKDMLRPMLKQWLDDNLPVMVERLVRLEIERVARGGRR